MEQMRARTRVARPRPRRLQSLSLWDPTSEPLPLPPPVAAQRPSSNAYFLASPPRIEKDLPPTPKPEQLDADYQASISPSSAYVVPSPALTGSSFWADLLSTTELTFDEEDSESLLYESCAPPPLQSSPPTHYTAAMITRPLRPLPRSLSPPASHSTLHSRPTLLIVPPSDGSSSTTTTMTHTISQTCLSAFPSPPLAAAAVFPSSSSSSSSFDEDPFFFTSKVQPSIAMRRSRSVPALVLSPILSSRYSISTDSRSPSPTPSIDIDALEETLASYFSPITPSTSHELPFGSASITADDPNEYSPFSLALDRPSPVLHGLALAEHEPLRDMIEESMKSFDSSENENDDNGLPSTFSPYSSPPSFRRSAATSLDNYDEDRSSARSSGSFNSSESRTPNMTMMSPQSINTSLSSFGIPDKGDNEEVWMEWEALTKEFKESACSDKVKPEERREPLRQLVQFGVAF